MDVKNFQQNNNLVTVLSGEEEEIHNNQNGQDQGRDYNNAYIDDTDIVGLGYQETGSSDEYIDDYYAASTFNSNMQQRRRFNNQAQAPSNIPSSQVSAETAAKVQQMMLPTQLEVIRENPNSMTSQQPSTISSSEGPHIGGPHHGSRQYVNACVNIAMVGQGGQHQTNQYQQSQEPPSISQEENITGENMNLILSGSQQHTNTQQPVTLTYSKDSTTTFDQQPQQQQQLIQPSSQQQYSDALPPTHPHTHAHHLQLNKPVHLYNQQISPSSATNGGNFQVVPNSFDDYQQPQNQNNQNSTSQQSLEMLIQQHQRENNTISSSSLDQQTPSTQSQQQSLSLNTLMAGVGVPTNGNYSGNNSTSYIAPNQSINTTNMNNTSSQHQNQQMQTSECIGSGLLAQPGAAAVPFYPNNNHPNQSMNINNYQKSQHQYQQQAPTTQLKLQQTTQQIIHNQSYMGSNATNSNSAVQFFNNQQPSPEPARPSTPDMHSLQQQYQ